MAKIYANLLLNGRKTWAQVPESIKSDVDAILLSMVADGTLTKAEYDVLVA